ncbi:MAG: hypothetical protein AB8I08_40870 [Sandaracinaceae bacterium]
MPHRADRSLGTSPPSESLRWLREQANRQLAYGVNDAVLQARGRVGDVCAAEAIAEQVFSPWRHRHQAGKDAMQALVDARGVAAVAGQLGKEAESWSDLLVVGRQPASRFASLVMASVMPAEDCLAALADADVAVAHAAHERLGNTDADALWAFADTHGGVGPLR